MTAPRSSFAMAMKDYTFIRPGIAVTISAATLVFALGIGFNLISSLHKAAATIERGARTAQTLHRYNAGIEVWQRMSQSTDPAYHTVPVLAQRDSIRDALRSQLAALMDATGNPVDQDLVRTVLEGLGDLEVASQARAREAMIVLLAHQDAALFEAARTAQRGVFLAAVLLACTVFAAGTLVVPMAWLYVRYKRGATIEVRI